MPTEKDEVVNKGVAKMDMLESLGLENIQIFLMPAKTMYDCYLSKKKYDFSKLGIQFLRKEELI